MRVTWDGLDRVAWNAVHRSAAGPLQQHWAYGQALASLGVPCLRAVVADGDGPLAQAQFLCRRIGPLATAALCTRGPVWMRETDPARRGAACRALASSLPLRRPRLVFISPGEPGVDGPALPAWRRVMTGQATASIDLAKDDAALRAAMDGKWRNRLAAAEKSPLRVQHCGARPAQYRWLLDRELGQRHRRGYLALPDGFVEAYQAADGGDGRIGPDVRPAGSARGQGADAGRVGAHGRAEPVLTLRADLGRDPAAGMMFLIHGDSATYHVGWAGDEGRRLGAHNLLLWQAMAALKSRGVRRLDLGGVDTQRGAGIARFKIGSGAQVMPLPGTWLL